LGLRLIVGQNDNDTEDQPSRTHEGKNKHKGRRKKHFQEKFLKKIHRKQMQFQTGAFNAFSFRR